MLSREFIVSFWRVTAIMLLVTAFAGRASADYQLQPGDIIEITVRGVPELSRKAMVREDGAISFPLIGDVRFAGLTLGQIRNNVSGMVRDKDILASPDVTVELVELRPIYIFGDVVRPGAYPYKPEYTIRHAVALAGGLDVYALRSGGRGMNSELLSEFQVQRLEFVRHYARIRRLKAELERKSTVDFGDLASLGAPWLDTSQIQSVEQEQFAAQALLLERDRASFARSYDETQRQLDALQEQERVETAGLQQQVEDLKRIKELSERGLTPTSKVTDEQRSILLTKARVTSTTAQVAAAKKSLEELRRQIEKLDEVRRLEANRELQQALLAAETSKAKMQAFGERIGSLARGQSGPMSSGDKLQFIIYRKRDAKEVKMAADAQTSLLSGDVIEVVVNRDLTPSAMQEPIR